MIRVVGKRGRGGTLEEWTALSAVDRTLLRKAAKKENVYARGFTKAAWRRLSMREKFAILEGKGSSRRPVEEQGKFAPFYKTFGRWNP